MFQSKPVRIAAGALLGGTAGVLLAAWLFQRAWSGDRALAEHEQLMLLLAHIFWGVVYGMGVGVAAAFRPMRSWPSLGALSFGPAGVLLSPVICRAVIGESAEPTWSLLMAVAGAFPLIGLAAGELAGRLRNSKL